MMRQMMGFAGGWNVRNPSLSSGGGRKITQRRGLRMGLGAKVLNEPKRGQKIPRKSNPDIAGELQSQIKMLYVDFLDPEGEKVDYEAMKKSSGFSEYEEGALGLGDFDPTRLNRDERLAFFLNVYNALVIHALVRLPKPKDNISRLGFYSFVSYTIGGNVYSLNDIEHNVLRGNKKQKIDRFNLFTFTKSDPRFSAIINPPDPRIHFGLNCGAMSCPPIRFYTADNLEFGLRVSTENFIADDENVRVLQKSRTVYLSKIFDWYKEDFAPSLADRELLEWIKDNAETDSPKEKELNELLSSEDPISISWLEYDWDVNSL